MDSRTPLYAASVTKQLMGVLTAQLVVEGRLDPDDSIAALDPELPAWTAPIRVRHLLHHTSGLPTTRQLLGAGGHERGLSNARVVRGLRELSGPARPPGEVFAYSNIGYVLLAEVLAVVTSAAVPALAAQRVFEPLALTDSHLGHVPAGTPPGAEPPATVGDGGWWTSARDLVDWLDALNCGLLGAEVSRLVQTPGRLDDGRPLDYGWGVTVRPDDAGAILTHGGNWPGWTAKTVRQPGSRTAVALLSTGDDVDAVSAAAVELQRRLSRGRPVP